MVNWEVKKISKKPIRRNPDNDRLAPYRDKRPPLSKEEVEIEKILDDSNDDWE